MKKYIKITVVLILIALGVVSCKAPCGCGGYGELENGNKQVEQYA